MSEKLKYRLRKTDTPVAGSIDKHYKTRFETFLRENYNDLSVPDNEINKIVELVSGIFSDQFKHNFNLTERVSVIYPSKFDRYFAYSLNSGNLSEIEFSRARELSSAEFNDRINKWVEKGLEKELQNRFEDINNYDDSEDFEKIITAIFHLANQKVLSEKSEKYYYVGYDKNDLINKLINDEGRLSESYYGGDKKKLNEFVSGLFAQASSPFFIEADFLGYISHHYDIENPLDIPISQEEIKVFVLGFFERYVNSVDKIDNNVWELYNDCIYATRVYGAGSSFRYERIHFSEANTIFINFIKSKALDDFLIDMISINSFRNEWTYGINVFVSEIFGSMDQFKKFLFEQFEPAWQNLAEFKRFYAEVENNNFPRGIKFNFETIDFSKKLK